MNNPTTALKAIVPGQNGRPLKLDPWRVGLAVATFAFLTIALSLDLVPLRFLGVRQGQPSVRTIVAPGSVRVVDAFATRQLQEEASAAVARQLTLDPTALSESIASIDRYYAEAAHLSGTSLTVARKAAALEDAAPPGVGKKVILATLRLPAARLGALSLETRRIVSVLLLGAVTQGELEQVRTAAASAAAALKLPASERSIISEVGQSVLAPTYVEDLAREAKLRAEAVAAVKPVVLSRQKGEVIVRQGEVVTRQHLLLLRALGLTRSRVDFSRISGVALLVIVGMVAMLLYLRHTEDWIYRSTPRMLILASLMAGTVIAGKAVTAMSPGLPVTVIPVAVAPMLATLLMNPQVGLVVALSSTLVLSTATQFAPDAIAWSFLACVFAVFATARVTTRGGFYRAGSIVTLAGGAVGVAVWLFAGAPGREALTAGAFGLVGGLLATVLTIGSLPFFETLFKITTDLKLADLVNPNQPLLRELTVKAPGTYNHSVSVGNLAEAAADAIGANAMLARAGAYYHDIGKSRRPSFFVENQVGGAANPHDNTNPRLSSLVIAAHVKEGVELAQKAGLPKEVIDIINQHHGTSVVSYFYQRAVEQEGYHAVNEDDFRYEGARPQSREAAVVMLADATEAVVRTLAKPTPQRIEAAARKIVQGKADDGQLDESHLTMCELDTVVKAFTAVLAGMYHQRVEYPETVTHEQRLRRAAHVGSDG